MELNEIRRARLRGLIDKHPGGLTAMAKKLGYRQPSFLSQMTSEKATREVTERTARRFERELGLAAGYMDQMPLEMMTVDVSPSAPADNVALVADVIRLVGTICSGEKVELGTMKFADVVAMAYVDTMEHNKTPRPEHIKALVRLLK